jgi:formylglycine-generating enzyme required for sulfatase activity/N-acetylneuraminic acid mutarotase
MTPAPHPNPHRFNQMTTPAKFSFSAFQPSGFCQKISHALLGVFFAAGTLPTVRAANTWQAEHSLQTARNQFAGGVINDKIYVFGGNGNPNEVNLKSIEMFDPAVGSWVYKAANEHNGGYGVEEVSAAAMNGKLYVFGAFGGPAGNLNFVEEFNPATNAWTSKAPRPNLRTEPAVVTYNNKIYLFDEPGKDTTSTSNLVEAYDPVANTWQAVTQMPEMIDAFAVAVVADKAYVFGGINFATERVLDDVSIYNFTTGTWTTGTLKLPAPRAFYRSGAPVLNGKIYLVSAYTGTTFNDLRVSSSLEIYNPAANSWETGPPLPTPTFGLSLIANNKLYVIGGDDSTNGIDNSVITDKVWSLVLAGPDVTTTAASGITATTATLNGTVNPNGLATTAQFEYGLTTAYGSTASVTLSPNNGTTAQNVSKSISGLQGGQTYHYRLSATNGSGTNPGADLTFATAPGELVAPRIAISGGNVNLTVQPSVAGRSYQLQVSDTLAAGSWQDVGAVRVGDGNNLVISVPYVPAVRQRFYRLALIGVSPAPAGFALIPAGPFQMGDQSSPLVGYSGERPVHTVQVSAFYIGKYEVTKEEWDAVRTWGLSNGYTDLAAGNGSAASKGANHPVHSITWYHVVKWCNARSQKEGLTPCYTVSGATYKTGQSAPACNWSANGYRLPTEAEWEKAARGGVAGKNFPWGTDTITHSQANYHSSSSYAYDVSPTRSYHPTYAVGGYPYSSPVGSFAPNGYGLYDMAGNMWEWCWDWYGSYAAGSQTDPRGAATGSHRVIRGGCWYFYANDARCAYRGNGYPPHAYIDFLGFRLARGQP